MLSADAASQLSLGKIFTFLFLTLGPLKVIGPFASMTRGRERAFKRKLAWSGTLVAAAGAFAAAKVGAKILEKWGVSIGSLLLTAGIVLFLVALQSVLQQYGPRDPVPPPAAPDGAPPKVSSLAFSPLAFPTIITPYGIAVLIIVITLSAGDATRYTQILEMTGLVLGLDLIAMLTANRIMTTPFVAPVLGVLGSVIGILQVALGVQMAVAGLRVLGIVPAAGG